MSQLATPSSLPSLVKPTLNTPFHIDYEWWERQGLLIEVELRTHLCPEHQKIFETDFDTEKIDWIDERTGEVTQVNGLQHVLQVHCSKQPDYINDHLSLVNAVFRIFLANGNSPLTCKELSNLVGFPATRILRTLSGSRVYKGLRPVSQDW